MDDLELARAAAHAGAAVVREAFGKRPSTTYKAADNPVTPVDEAAEAVILDVIRSERPDDDIVAEESGDSRARPAAATRRWLVDPLDGTVNFIHAIPHVAVSVAVYERDEPLAGAVVDVIRGHVFAAAAGEGARLDGEPIHVSDQADLGRAVIATGFPYDHKLRARAYADWLSGVLAEVQGVRRMGCASLDFAWLAAGRFDGYYDSDLGAWDAGAGLLLVHEAGGVVTGPNAEPYRPGDPVLVGSNGRIQESLRAVVRAGLPEHLGG